MNVSEKIKDIKPGRVVELAATDARKATAIMVHDVTVFMTSVKVTGVKLDRSGKPHRSGKTHDVNVIPGEFRVSWEDEAQTVVSEAEEAQTLNV